MKIIVCVKQVPDTSSEVKFNPDGTLNRAAMKSIMNPDDKAGLEAALQIKDKIKGVEITAITMGLPKAEEVLREALALGADNAILLTDRALGGSDTYATSLALANAIKNLDYDLIITGRQAIDGDTAQVGPGISEHLGIPVISYAEKIEIEDNCVLVNRQYEDRVHIVKAKLPCLVTALSEAITARFMTPKGIWAAYEKPIKIMTRADLKDVKDEELGLGGSPTKIAKSSDKVKKGAGVQVELSGKDASDYIVNILKEKHYI